jgi:hypothetical protein
LQGGDQPGQFIPQDGPEDVELNVGVVVAQAVLHADDLAPFDLGVGSTKFLGHLVCRFADDPEAANDGGLMPLACVELRLVQALDEAQRVANRKLYVQ